MSPERPRFRIRNRCTPDFNVIAYAVHILDFADALLGVNLVDIEIDLLRE